MKVKAEFLIGHHSGTQQTALANWCPYAQTVTGWSFTLHCNVIVQIRCKRWGCRVCGERRAVHLAKRVENANPNRLLTLTVNRNAFETAREAWQKLSPKVSRFADLARREFGSFEAFRVLEVTKAGWPHWHQVVRSSYLPHAWVRDTWTRLAQSPIVDIRKITNRHVSTRYIMKYLCKQKYIPWTNRRCSWTRNFFPKEDKREGLKLELDGKEILGEHPTAILSKRYHGQRAKLITNDCVAIESCPNWNAE